MVVQPASPEVLSRCMKGFECWNGGEIDLMTEMYDEDAEFDPSAVFTDLETARGRDALRRYFHDMWETWEGIRMDPIEVLDAGETRSGERLLVVPLRLWGKGKRSGAEVDQTVASLYTMRLADEMIVRNRLFPTKEAALAAAEKEAEG